MEDTIKIELLTPLTGTFLPNEMEQDWEEEDYNDFEEEQVFFEGDDLTEYASVIQEKIAEYNRVGHDDDRTDNLMDYFDGSAAIKEKVVSAVPSVKESDGVLYGCTTLELKEYLEAEELSELCEYLTGQYSDGWGEGLLWSSIFVTLMANKIGGLQFGIYRNCQISSRVFHTAVAALPLTKANRSDFE